MNFDLGETEKELCHKIEQLFGPESVAILARLRSPDTRLIRDTLLEWLKALARTGYLSLGLDHGRNSTLLTAAQETLAAVSPSLFLSVEVNARIFGRLVAVYGTPEQQALTLTPVTKGLAIGAVALTEGAANIEDNPPETKGVPYGDSFHVSGVKGRAINVPVADWIAISGMTGSGTALFLINREENGLYPGQRDTTLGYSGTAASPISLKDCPVPPGQVIGPFEGQEPLLAVRTWEDQVLTTAALGGMKRSFAAALDYAKTHISGGRPIIEYQEVGFKLAEMLTLLQTSRLLVYRAAWMDETGDRDKDVLARCAKVFCTESAEEVASNALQVMGTQGCVMGNPAEEGYRDAKHLQVSGTSTEISRMKIGDLAMKRE